MFPALAFADAADAATAATTGAESMGFFEWIFGTYAGMGTLIGFFLLLSLAMAFVLERRTRRVFKDRGPADSDSFFSDDDE